MKRVRQALWLCKQRPGGPFFVDVYKGRAPSDGGCLLYTSGGDYEAALRLGTACGSATAFSLGLATKADIDKLLKTME